MKDYNQFNKYGYIIKRKFLKNETFLQTANQLTKAVEEKINNINLKKVGGSYCGNVACHPGKYGKIILKLLKKNGLEKLIINISKKKLKDFDILIGGNLSMPKGYDQILHRDFEYDDDRLLINVATSDISKNSGPTELVPILHKYKLPFWKFILSKKKKIKLIMSKGDVSIRKHDIWHRGTRNNSNKFRFLIIIHLIKKNLKKKNYKYNEKSINDNEISIANNFFDSGIKGRIKEIIYTNFQFLFITIKFIISLIKSITNSNNEY